MQRALVRICDPDRGVWHIVEGRRVEGPHTELRGDVSGLCGDVDMCGRTDEDRRRGVDVADLVFVGVEG